MVNPYIKGLRDAAPIGLGYIPIGVAFGVLAVQQGLTVYEIFFMSLLVYAGSSQFIAASLIASGAAAASIVFTTFLVNLRHILMSASLSPYLKHIVSPIQAAISFGITDETYAVGITRVSKETASAKYFAGLHITSQMFWIASTVLGGLLGNFIPSPERWGIDYALSAMFIGLLVAQIKNRIQIIVCICAGIISLIMAVELEGNWNIIIATILAATIGVFTESWMKKFSLSLSE